MWIYPVKIEAFHQRGIKRKKMNKNGQNDQKQGKKQESCKLHICPKSSKTPNISCKANKICF